MDDKLKQITDRLYEEGLSKGKAEAEEIVSKAKAEAARIIEDARKKASGIIENAKAQAQSNSSRIEGDIRMAAEQTITSVRQKIEDIITTKAIDSPISEALNEAEFAKGLIATVTGAFDASAQEQKELELILPASMKREIESRYASSIRSAMDKGISVSYSGAIAKGFRIGPKDSGYVVSFTDEAFSLLFKEYLRPTTRRILFGE